MDFGDTAGRGFVVQSLLNPLKSRLQVSLQPGENGWEKVEQRIDQTFKAHSHVMIESLGAGEAFGKFRASLEKNTFSK
ncbi:MAG: hypothetical protein HC840_08370 [Leptolyngbyaceae cyanobacterium RM2_2_4]|nr:hypothetical protein [Leptolyngbyaceae cyanobacterium RM2_2_4]